MPNAIVTNSKVGPLTIVEEGDTIVGIMFGNFAKRQSQNMLLKRAAKQISEYMDGRRKVFDLPLSFGGTEFENAVYTELLKIPFGRVVSYEDVAKRVGRPRACRAVGNAVGKNPIALVIPCHRVVGKNNIGGFGSAIHIKKYLLDLEKSKI